jgi:hypothetical protein
MVELQPVITCPECGYSATETMPTDACQYIYNCKGGAVASLVEISDGALRQFSP